jgi:hypothetical protein
VWNGERHENANERFLILDSVYVLLLPDFFRNISLWSECPLKIPPQPKTPKKERKKFTFYKRNKGKVKEVRFYHSTICPKSRFQASKNEFPL